MPEDVNYFFLGLTCIISPHPPHGIVLLNVKPSTSFLDISVVGSGFLERVIYEIGSLVQRGFSSHKLTGWSCFTICTVMADPPVV